MKKIFTLAAAVLASFSLFAETLYSTDCKEAPESPATASIEKGAFATTAESWASSYANYFKTTGSSGQITLTFNPAISLAGKSDVKVKVYWGSTSNRPLNLSVNGGAANEIDKISNSAERSVVRTAEGAVSVSSLESIKLSSSGGGDVYIFHVEVIAGDGGEQPGDEPGDDPQPVNETFALWRFSGSDAPALNSSEEGANIKVEFLTSDDSKSFATESAAYNVAVPDDLKSQGSKGVKLGANALYLKVTLGDGDFLAGDQITISGYKPFKISSTAEHNGDISSSLATGTSKGDYNIGAVTLTEDAEALYIMRAESTGTGIAAIKVVRPEQKEVDRIDTALVGAAINGVALGDTDLGLLLESRTNTVYIPSPYVSAPTVTFVEQTSTYYVGETDPKVATKNIDVVATVANDVWQAQATIGGNTYTVQMAKAASVTVTYMDGETTLGTETIAQGGKVAENAKYETKAGCTFAGWYTDAALTTAADLTAAVNADMTLYGKFEKKYINHSIFIDQLVLDYGTKYDIKADLTKYGWEYANLNALDSLNDLENKPNRNADFLGLKMKTAGAYIAGWLAAGDGIVIRFGNIGSDIKVSAKGATTDTEMTITAADLKDPEFYDSEFPIYGFTEDVYVTISTVDGGTVVLKQIIKIEDEFIDVVLPAPGAYMVNVAEAENGTVTANWENKKYRAPVGATVTLTVTPAEGYKIATVTLDSEALTAVEGVYSFVMPAKEVNVAATFVAEGGETAITNTEAAVKAVKVIREGKLFIEKNGVLYNAQGSVVK